MSDLKRTIYVAIRTAPIRVRRALASALPMEGDEATSMVVDRILSALEGYDIKKSEKPPGPGPRADCGHPSRK